MSKDKINEVLNKATSSAELEERLIKLERFMASFAGPRTSMSPIDMACLGACIAYFTVKFENHSSLINKPKLLQEFGTDMMKIMEEVGKAANEFNQLPPA